MFERNLVFYAGKSMIVAVIVLPDALRSELLPTLDQIRDSIDLLK